MQVSPNVLLNFLQMLKTHTRSYTVITMPWFFTHQFCPGCYKRIINNFYLCLIPIGVLGKYVKILLAYSFDPTILFKFQIAVGNPSILSNLPPPAGRYLILDFKQMNPDHVTTEKNNI
jgi:hypothetical protein